MPRKVRHRSTRRARSRPVHDVPAHIERQRKRPTEEGVPDLWDLPGQRLEANPKVKDHHPVFRSMVNTDAERVNVIRWDTVYAKIDSSGIEQQVNRHTPIEVPELWTGPRHIQLTHALRLLQLCCVSKKVREVDFNLLIGPARGVGANNPAGILAGAGSADAGQLVKELQATGLLKCMSQQKGDLWAVNMRVRGFGPDMNHYEAHQLTDGWGLPKETEMNGGYGSQPRYETLTTVYNFLKEMLPSSNKEDDDGWVEIKVTGSMLKRVADKLGVSVTIAQGLLADLEYLKYYRHQNLGGGKYRRFVNVWHATVSPEQAEEARNDAREREEIRRKRRQRPEGRLGRLHDAHQVLLETVPEGTVPNSDGVAEFSNEISYATLLKDRLGLVSNSVAEKLMQDLALLGLLKNERTRGKLTHRWLKLKHQFTDQDLLILRAGRSTAASTSSARSGSPDEYGIILTRMDEEITDLKRQLDKEQKDHERTKANHAKEIARLQAELETARSQPVTPVPEHLRKRYLDGK